MFMISFEKSPRHEAFVPKFEAELSQFCEKLVGLSYFSLGRSVLQGFFIFPSDDTYEL